jgi:hypothetical protein
MTGLVFAISIVFTPIYYICTFRWKSGMKELNRWFFKMALSVDQFGNVSCSKVLEKLFTKRYGHPFGHEDDSVSYVLGRNQFKKTLTPLGRMLVNLLNAIDNGHCTNAIFNKIDSDKEAVVRFQEDKYFQ